MEPTRQLTFPTRRGLGKKVAVHQTASTQSRYVTVISPASAVNTTAQDAMALPEQPKLSDRHARGKENPLPKQPLQSTPPPSSRYVEMLLEQDKMPWFYGILASLFTRLLLAGYIVFPGTFTSLRTSNVIKNTANRNKTEKHILDTVQNVPLLWLAGLCCVFAASGMAGVKSQCATDKKAGLWLRWKTNYNWLVKRLFLPSLLNAIFGLVNTLINVYTVQDGDWSVTATITAIITGTCTGISLILFLVYNYWLLYRIKQDHKSGLDSKE